MHSMAVGASSWPRWTSALLPVTLHPLTHKSGFLTQQFQHCLRRWSRELQGFLRLCLRSSAVSLLQHSVGQSKSPGQPIFQGKGHRFHPVLVCFDCLTKHQYHRLSGWTTEMYCFTVLQARSLRSRYHQGWFLLKPLSLAYRCPPSPRVLICSSLCVSISIFPLLIRTLVIVG